MDTEERARMMQWKQQGFYCSQILMLLALEMQGKENVDLVRAMHGLSGGIGFSGDTCGALTGGACLLGLYAGKGLPEEEEDLKLNFMIIELVNWFKEGYGKEYGGIMCQNILAGNSQNKAVRCPLIVAETFQKVKDLLVENGFDLYGNVL